MTPSPEYTPLYKNDITIRSWKDLKARPIASLRHFDCALLVESNRESVGVYHHPASDADGEAGRNKISGLKEKLRHVNTSCVIHRSEKSYSQAALIHKIEQSLGIIPSRSLDIDLSSTFSEGEPLDIIITDEGIYANTNEQSQLLVSSSELRK